MIENRHASDTAAECSWLVSPITLSLRTSIIIIALRLLER